MSTYDQLPKVELEAERIALLAERKELKETVQGLGDCAFKMITTNFSLGFQLAGLVTQLGMIQVQAAAYKQLYEQAVEENKRLQALVDSRGI